MEPRRHVELHQMNEYDLMHFEALGLEARHLEEETAEAQRRKELPEGLRHFMTPETVQDFLKAHPKAVLPAIITTKTHSVLPDSYLDGDKKSIVTRSAGYDHLEHLAARANIVSLREYCVNAVAQTAMKFIYAAAGELNHYTKNTATFERNKSRAFMEFDWNRIVTVFGVGKIGRRICELAEANGLCVQGVDLRRELLNEQYEGKVRFVSKEEAVGTSDIMVNAMNLTRNQSSPFCNVGYFSREYLSRAKSGLIFVNVSRGEIAPESVLWEQYSEGRIRGIGLDVFSDEAVLAKALQGGVTEGADLGADQGAAVTMIEKSLDRSANIYVQPHQAFNSDRAAKTKAAETIKHLIAWYGSGGQRFPEQLPYYSQIY